MAIANKTTPTRAAIKETPNTARPRPLLKLASTTAITPLIALLVQIGDRG